MDTTAAGIMGGIAEVGTTVVAGMGAVGMAVAGMEVGAHAIGFRDLTVGTGSGVAGECWNGS